jgi:CMP-N-acetylneuraminic acid synthetase
MIKKKIIAEIPARGGSKGVPRKALQRIGGIPLIAYTIRDAINIPGITKVFVNTDDPEIQAVSIEHGAEVPFLRPRELAQDNSRLEDASQYARDWYRDNEGFGPDIEIVMSPTHPFRRRNLVGNALNVGIENPKMFNIGSIAQAKVFIDNYWVNADGKIMRYPFSLNGDIPIGNFYESAFSFNIVFSCRSGIPNERVPVTLNEIEAIDIDEPRDLDMARLVIEKGLYPFNE